MDVNLILSLSLSDLFGSLRKPTERAEAGPYTRTLAKKKIRWRGKHDTILIDGMRDIM